MFFEHVNDFRGGLRSILPSWYIIRLAVFGCIYCRFRLRIHRPLFISFPRDGKAAWVFVRAPKTLAPALVVPLAAPG